jgi:hypothetical protein
MGTPASRSMPASSSICLRAGSTAHAHMRRGARTRVCVSARSPTTATCAVCDASNRGSSCTPTGTLCVCERAGAATHAAACMLCCAVWLHACCAPPRRPTRRRTRGGRSGRPCLSPPAARAPWPSGRGTPGRRTCGGGTGAQCAWAWACACACVCMYMCVRMCVRMQCMHVRACGRVWGHCACMCVWAWLRAASRTRAAARSCTCANAATQACARARARARAHVG